MKSTDIEMQLEESKNDEDESLAIIAKGFKMMFQKNPKFKGIWKGSTSKRNERNFRGKFASKSDTNQNTCYGCLLYTSPSPRDGLLSRMPSSA